MKYFNTTGICLPKQHYMVDTSDKIEQIKAMVAQGDYFTINRARQYGKTTTLRLLENSLSDQYVTFLISFEGSDSMFASIEQFVKGFQFKLSYEMEYMGLNSGFVDAWQKEMETVMDFDALSMRITRLCQYADKKIVLLIDEVDRSSDNQIFLGFLGMLRSKYLERDRRATFWSVILAGVYDIKNLKLQFRTKTEHKYNSPWNVAADFNVDMSFSPVGIAGMLQEYEEEHKTGMDIMAVARMIWDYTSGYPFLVSRICKLLDEQIAAEGHVGVSVSVWCKDGIIEAVKVLLIERNTLFDDMIKKLRDYQELRRMLYTMLFQGRIFLYNPDNYAIDIGIMFGFIKVSDGKAVIANRLFETRIYNWFISEEILDSQIYDAAVLDRNQYIESGRLNMDMVLEKFIHHFTDIYGEQGDKFLEENGRRFFLLYLKPIINGVGNYYVEAQTRDMKRTDIIIDYRGEQYVIELKIWRGDEYNRRGEKQLTEYLDYYHLEKGYMLSFCFNKNKEIGLHEIMLDGKILIEAVV